MADASCQTQPTANESAGFVTRTQGSHFNVARHSVARIPATECRGTLPIKNGRTTWEAARPFVSCAGKYQSDYFPLAVGFFAAGALVAFAAPVFAFVDLAAPVFAFVDFGDAVFAAVFAPVDFAAVLFAAMSIFLHEEICGTREVCRMFAGARHEQPRVLNRLRWGQTRPISSNLSGL